MAELRRLQPHDPVPEGGRYMLVLRRFGEDAPDVALSEIIVADGSHAPELIPAVTVRGEPMTFDQALQLGQREADRRGYRLLYAVDRTAGPQESAVQRHHGNRLVGEERFVDTDPEDLEQGADLRDRPANAGYNLGPRR